MTHAGQRVHKIIQDRAKLSVIAKRVTRFWHMSNYIIPNAREKYSAHLHSFANKEPRRILEAITAGNDEAAELLMERHIMCTEAKNAE